MVRWPVVIGSLLMLLPGCRETTSPMAPADYVGVYWLRAVNNASLPESVSGLPAGCTTTYQNGVLVLSDRAFNLYLWYTFACPGFSAMQYSDFPVGGGLTVNGSSLTLTAIDPNSPTSATMDARVSLEGTDALLTLPAGAMNLAAATTLRLGPRQSHF